VPVEGGGCVRRDGDGALAVHPYDLVQTAGALHEALSMPAAERARRAGLLSERAVARTPAMWLDDQFARAVRT